MKIVRDFSMEYMLFGLILALILPFSYLFASFENYTYSLPIVVLSVLYLVIYQYKYHITPLRQIMVCFLLLTILTSFSYFTYGLNYTSYPNFLCNAMIPFVLFLVCSAYSSRNKSERFIVAFFLVYYAIGIYYISYQQTIRESMLQQINNFYFVITPLPFLFLIEKSLLRILFLVISSICVIISLKRSGFVIILLLLAYTTYFYGFSNLKLKRKVLFIAFCVGVAAIAVNYMDSQDIEYYDRLLARMENISEDGGSGRTDIFEESQVMIKNMNALEWIVGKGYSASDSEEQTPNGFHSFHNDYSEMMYSYGLIGIILLLGLIINLFNKCRYSRKFKSRYRFALASSFIIFCVFSVTSSVFHYTYYMLPLFMFWGYVEAQLKHSFNKTVNNPILK